MSLVSVFAIVAVAAPFFRYVTPNPAATYTPARWAIGRSRLLVADEGAVHLLDSRGGKVLRALKGHAEQVQTVSIDPKEGRALTSSFVYDGETLPVSRDTSTRLWNLGTGKGLLRLDGEGFGHFSPTGERFLTISSAGGVRAFSSGGDATVHVYGARLRRRIASVPVSDLRVESRPVRFALREGAIVAPTTFDVRVFDILRGGAPSVYALDEEQPMGFDVSRSGDRLLVHSYGGFAVWDLRTGALLLRVREPARRATNDNVLSSVVFLHDERRVVAVVRGVATVFRVADGVRERELTVPGEAIGLTSDPDADRLLVEWTNRTHDGNALGVICFAGRAPDQRFSVRYGREHATLLLGFVPGRDEFATLDSDVRYYSGRTGRLLRRLSNDPASRKRRGAELLPVDPRATQVLTLVPYTWITPSDLVVGGDG